MFYRFIVGITDIGDSAVLLAVVLTVSVCLLAQGARRDALVFACAFFGTSLAISVTKILLMGCGSHLRDIGLRSPSGHSALSLCVLGSLALLFRNRIQGRHRNLPLFILLPLAVAIGFSRVVLGAHTREEVVAGMIIGTAAVLITNRFLLTEQPRPVNLKALAFLSLAVIFATHGLKLPAENIISLIASHFRHIAHCK